MTQQLSAKSTNRGKLGGATTVKGGLKGSLTQPTQLTAKPTNRGSLSGTVSADPC